jgi:transposase
MSVSGVGPITALSFTAIIEDPHRFARSEDVGAYAELVPRRSQSGERDVSGHISKPGDPMLRRDEGPIPMEADLQIFLEFRIGRSKYITLSL